MGYYNKSVALLVIALASFGSLRATAAPLSRSTTSSIQTSEADYVRGNFQIAQGLVGQCRTTNRTIDVFSEPSLTSSQTVRTIDADQKVTLADSGSNGWIKISAPVEGFVLARYLKECPEGSTAPTPAPENNQENNTDDDSQSDDKAGQCRQVTVAQGLTIRSTPSSSASKVGGVFQGQTIKLAGESKKDDQGRTWVQITAPMNGWVSSGFPEGNLGSTMSCP